MLDLLPGRPVANVDDRKRALTLAHLLTMSTGLACYADPGEITLQEMRRSDDWAQFVLDLRMIENPGARFEYCSPASYLLSVILQQATGRTGLDFARAHLFGPLGIEDVVWPPSPQGVTTGWGDLHLTPRDMAKIGTLFLHQGRHDGRQVVSREWVTAATRKHAAPPGHFGYGYGWWLASPDVYAANGRGGQQIIVAPALDAVAVLTAGLSPEQGAVRDELIDSLLLPALRSDAALPANPAGAARLRDVAQEARQPRDDPRPLPSIPALARRVDGHEYRLDANAFGLRAFSLSLAGGAEARLRGLRPGRRMGVAHRPGQRPALHRRRPDWAPRRLPRRLAGRRCLHARLGRDRQHQPLAHLPTLRRRRGPPRHGRSHRPRRSDDQRPPILAPLRDDTASGRVSRRSSVGTA